MGSRVRHGHAHLGLSSLAHWVSVSAFVVAWGCGGGNDAGLFGGNDETDAGNAGLDGSVADAQTEDQTSSDESSRESTSDSSGDASSSNVGQTDAGETSGASDEVSSDAGSSVTNDSSNTTNLTTTEPTTTEPTTAEPTTTSEAVTTSEPATSEPTSTSDSDGGSTDPASTSDTQASDSTSDSSEPQPGCAITTPSKSLLNGVAAPEGDRASTSGAYAIRVEVATTQPEGSFVLLAVSDESPRLATVQGGVAVFQLVTLPEGAQSSLQATCQGPVTLQSDVLLVTVDAQPPTLDENGISPIDAQQLLPSDDRDPEAIGTNFDVCVPVTSEDALDVGEDNVCVTLGSERSCAPATASGVADGIDGACVRMQCDGETTFDLDVVVTDAAGNKATHTVAGVECATSNLLVELVDRRHTSFRLNWTEATEPVSGYQVAFMKVDADDAPPLDAESFDEATSIQVVDADTHDLLIEDLSIEQRYHFAVRPMYESEEPAPAPVLATPLPLRARFETQVLQAPANSEGNQWGYSVDGSSDLNGDGASDLVVGQGAGDRVSVYFGHVGGGFSTEPDVVINGPVDSLFGVSVAVVGKILDTDTEYLAVAASNFDVNGRVYLLPITSLDQSVVDLTAGENTFGPVVDFPEGPGYPLHVARLGDFDGDGVDDFAMHAAVLGATDVCDLETGDNCTGALVVVRGGASFPAAVSVPTDSSWAFVFFPSDVGYYGTEWLLGISDLNTGQSGVLAAEWQQGVTRLISYDDTQPEEYGAQVLDVGAPVFDDEVFDTELGLYPSVLTGVSSLAVPMTGGRTSDGVGVVELYTLDPTSTFSSEPALSLTALGNNNNAGQVLIGSRFGGRAPSYGLPLFGSEVGAPLVLGGRYFNNNLPILYMLRSNTLSALPTDVSVVDVAAVADVAFDLSTVPGISSEWANGPEDPRATADWHGGLGFGVHDVNGDGYMDLGIAEWNTDPDYVGGIVVLY